MPNSRPPDDPYEDYEDAESLGPLDRLQQQFARTQAQLAELRRQQETIERQKRELEELTKRKQQLREEREETLRELRGTLAAFDRETFALEKRIEEIATARDALARHLDAVDHIDPTRWAPENDSRELSVALTAVAEARADHERLAPKLLGTPGADLGGGSYDVPLGEDSFVEWLRNGLAFTLPLLILGLIALIAYLVKG